MKKLIKHRYNKLYGKSLYRFLFLINFTCMFLNISFMGIGGMFITAYAVFLNIDAAQLGIISSFAVLTNILQLFSPYILSRFKSRKKILIILLIIKYIFYIPIIFIPLLNLGKNNYILLTSLIVVSNCFSALMGSGLIDWNDRYVDMNHKGEYYSNRNMIANIISVINTIIIGNILTRFSEKYIIYISVFIFIMLMSICEIYVLVLIPEPEAVRNNKYKIREIINPLKDKLFNKYIMFTCIWGFSIQICLPFFTIYAISQMKYTYAFIGTAASIASFAKIFIAHPCGKIGDRVGWSKIFRLSGIIFPLTILMWAFLTPSTKLLYIIIIFINGISMIVINIAIFNVSIFLTNYENRLMYFAVNSTCTAIFSFLGAFIGSILISNYAGTIILGIDIYKIMFIFTGIVAAGISVYFASIFKKFELEKTSSIQK